MKYVLLTHVPTYPGQSPGVVRMTEAFRDDLLAEAAALRQAGFDLTLATPRHASPDAKALASERFVDVKLAQHGVADAPLPAYRTMPQFVAARAALEKTIVQITRDAAVVQLGAGGHPTALGQFAWPLIDALTSKRVFVFAGDPLPGRRRAIVSGRNPAKRLAKGLAVRSFDTFCRQAVRESDLVFAHDPAVAKRFNRDWNDRCHTFARPPIGDADLAGPAVLARRQKRLGDATRPLRLVTLGPPTATAGVDHLLQAVAKVRRLGVTAVLALAPGSAPPGLAALRTELGLEGAVTQDDGGVAASLDAGDLFVSAPLVPGENPAIFSAAARGLPIVSYWSGAADHEAADAGGLIGVDRGETDRLSSLLLELSRDRPKLAAMAESARGWAEGVTRDGVHRSRAALVRQAVQS